MSIQLPPKFEEKLRGHNRENGIVHSALNAFGEWFETSGTPFFRDYTDHGEKHVENVLATAATMISDEAESILTVNDVTMFVLATLLHDAALHLAEPGFQQLITGKAQNRKISFFDNTVWPSLWEEFLFTARHWDDNKLTDLFGNEFTKQGCTITNPFDRWNNLTQFDYKLIGEFIRQHHARLAHEFAIFGVPGIKDDFIKLPQQLPSDLCDLSGVIARSHGISLRESLNYLIKNFHKREYQSIHAIYLMAILRLSDFVQIESNRAPEIVFQYRIIPSKTSVLEWRTHQSVKNITPEHEDPESVEVRAEPTDVETYLRLQKWLEGIQNELDTSWAVLGEVYGRYENLNGLGIRWRRIRSNLDDYNNFAKTVSFVPRRIRLEVARAEMLSLLIKPLYGDDPSYGVRELIQNSVDAVREREYFQKHYPQYKNVTLRDQKEDVVAWLSDFNKEENYAIFQISDRGIGMTEKILIDYFLTAGASYRHSEEWQRVFEQIDTSNGKLKAHSKVLRAGRFGIGALATFLLGNEIEVETRHITSAIGFRFKMFLTQDAIHVEQDNSIDVGTLIKVRLDYKTFKNLQNKSESLSKPAYWDWYVLDNPKVKRIKGKSRSEIESQFKIDLSQWNELKADLPYKVHWMFSNNAPHLSCNGIFVSDANRLPKISEGSGYRDPYVINTPNIHISDPDGFLPLNLTRKELLTESYGFEALLKKEVIKDFFARLLVTFPEEIDERLISLALAQASLTKYEAFGRSLFYIPCLLNPIGFCLPIQKIITELCKPKQKLLFLSGEDALKNLTSVRSWDFVVVYPSDYFGDGVIRFSNDGYRYQRNSFYEETEEKNSRISNFKHANIRSNKDSSHSRSQYEFLSRNELENDSHTKDTLSYKSLSLDKKKSEKIWCRETKNFKESIYPFEKLAEEFIARYKSRQYNQEIVDFRANVSEVCFEEAWKPDCSQFVVLDEPWNTFFGDKLIPWNRKDRLKMFPKAFEILAPYIARYEK